MRFFSNEAKDNVDDQDDQDDRTERGDGVPQQRAGSPWRDTPTGEESARDTLPDNDPGRDTPVGAETGGDASHGDASHHEAADRDASGRAPGWPDDAGTHRDLSDEDTARIGNGQPGGENDTTQEIGNHRTDEDRTTPWDRDGTPDSDRSGDSDGTRAEDDDEARAEVRGAEAEEDAAEARRTDSDETADTAADQAVTDRGTFDDPQVADDVPAEPVPVVAAAVPVTAAGAAAVPASAAPASASAGPAASGSATAAGPAPFFPESQTQALRDRWRDVQLRFVDDPKASTAEAAALVDETIEQLTTALRQHRGSFAGGGDDTEALRVELRAYRDILDRLLGL